MKRKLAFQSLESRRLLAVDLLSRTNIGDVPPEPELSTVWNFGATAYVIGTDQSNGVRVMDDTGESRNPSLPNVGQIFEITDQQQNGSAVISRYLVDSKTSYAYLRGGNDIFVNEDLDSGATAYGNAGDDVLIGVQSGIGGAGNDRIEMADPIFAYIGSTFAYGGAGDDVVISAGANTEILIGGSGDDVVENARSRYVFGFESVNAGVADKLTEDEIDEFFERLISGAQ